MRIDINAVAQQRLFSQDPMIHKPVHDPLSIMFQAVVKILDPLRHMDVIADFIRLLPRCQFHGLVRDRKLGVHSHHSRYHPRVVLQGVTDKLRILHHGFSRLVHSVPV